MDNMTVNMTEVARQAVSDTAVDIGDSFTYQIIADLPAIAANSGLNVTIEIFAVNTITGFCS